MLMEASSLTTKLSSDSSSPSTSEDAFHFHWPRGTATWTFFRIDGGTWDGDTSSSSSESDEKSMTGARLDGGTFGSLNSASESEDSEEGVAG